MGSEIKLSGCAFRLNLDRPYLAAALWSLVRIPVQGLGTVAVDQFWRLYYDPEAVERYCVEELTGVLYHEVCHLLRDHASRRPPEADPLDWNIAADAEINDDLRHEGVVLPKGAIYPEKIRQKEGLLAEQYWGKLPRGKNGICTIPDPRCGSCATGVREEWEYEEGRDPPGIPPPVSTQEAAVLREVVARTMLEETPGTLPGHWRRWAEAYLAPQVNWRRLLSAIIRSSVAQTQGAADYSYRRPSRRQRPGSPILLPSLTGADPIVSVIVDTSGSMTDETQSMALTEIVGILRSIGMNHGLRVLAVDSAVQWSRRVIRADQVRLLGGGGTDLRVGFKRALAETPRPEVIIVMTDGRSLWPESPPRRVRVVVACTDPKVEVPDWTHCVRLTAVQ
jgi:predicted metal-dependent peptidase